MTNDHRPPTPPTPDDEFDSIVSRRVDGDIDALAVPVEMRAVVEDRVAVVSSLRVALLETGSSLTVRDDQIAVALSSGSTSRISRFGRSMSSPARFGIAASFIGLVAVSLLVVRQTGSGVDEGLAESALVVTTEFPFRPAMTSENMASENDGSEGEIAVSRDDPSDPAESKEQSPGLSDSEYPDTFGINASPETVATEDPTMIAEFSTIDEIAVFAASLAFSQLEPKPTLPDRSSPICDRTSTRPRVVRQVRVGDRLTEIHVIEKGMFTLYDISDCSVLHQTTVEASTSTKG